MNLIEATTTREWEKEKREKTSRTDYQAHGAPQLSITGGGPLLCPWQIKDGG
tara:strand:- start:3296 stop:3451 length:156 start_codon:yes stop_codon:yes gene_type:complete